MTKNFLLAGNAATIALQENCGVLKKITTFVVVVIMENDSASIIRMDMTFEEGTGTTTKT